MIRRQALAAMLVPLCLAVAARPGAAAWPHDPNVGNVALCTAANIQAATTMVPDGAGGAFVAWLDLRGGTDYDVYAQHVSAAGVPLWGVNGVAVCTAVGDQLNQKLASDRSGGIIVTWTDNRSGTSGDIYAQRLNAAGAPQWTANGVVVCDATGDQTKPVIVVDGPFGIVNAVIAWQDLRGGATTDIYAQRINDVGAPVWAANGVSVCSAVRDQLVPTMVATRQNGVIIAWEDNRNTAIGARYEIYAQWLNLLGAPQYPVDGVVLCTAANNRFSPNMVPDGADGAYLTWYDFRNGTTADVYAQRLRADFAGGAAWGTGGVALCTAAGSQLLPTITADATGATVAWEDNRSGNYDIYVQRVDPAGLVQWTTDGVALCTAVHDQFSPVIVSDGSGGAIVAWHDGRNVNSDIYAQRVGASGSPLWPADGVALSTAPRAQQYAAIAADGAGGAIVAWEDSRGSDLDIYAQRVEPYGHLGNPEPVITSVKDVSGDQGGSIKLSWAASYLDADPIYGVLEYRIFRHVPGGPAGWEYVRSQPADGLAAYSMVVPTGVDSIAGNNPTTRFFVLALASTGENWSSPPDSGYSVDNLPPATPSPFTGRYLSGAAHLHWGRNTEIDLAGYRLYRGTDAFFAPGPGNQIAAPPDTGYVDVASDGFVYKLTAIDVHGNQSAPATLLPNGTVDVGDTPAPALRFAAPSPNPARGSTTLDFALSRPGHVRVALFDVTGRLVQVLRDGELAAGAHRERIALHDAAGRELASGLFLIRLEAEGRVLTRRLATIR